MGRNGTHPHPGDREELREVLTRADAVSLKRVGGLNECQASRRVPSQLGIRQDPPQVLGTLFRGTCRYPTTISMAKDGVWAAIGIG